MTLNLPVVSAGNFQFDNGSSEIVERLPDGRETCEILQIERKHKLLFNNWDRIRNGIYFVIIPFLEKWNSNNEV